MSGGNNIHIFRHARTAIKIHCQPTSQSPFNLFLRRQLTNLLRRLYSGITGNHRTGSVFQHSCDQLLILTFTHYFDNLRLPGRLFNRRYFIFHLRRAFANKVSFRAFIIHIRQDNLANFIGNYSDHFARVRVFYFFGDALHG